MAEKFGGRALLTSKNPDENEIKAVSEKAADADSIVISTYNGHLQPGQLELVRALAEKQLPVAVVALRNPYDLAELPENAVGIAAWDNSLMTLKVLEEMFRGEWQPTGNLPIRL